MMRAGLGTSTLRILAIAVTSFALCSGLLSAAGDFDSLRSGIAAANSGGNGAIALVQDIILSAALPPITGSLTIDGGGHSISGNGAQRIFDVNGGSLTLSNVTLTGGRADFGGAIRLRNGAQLTLEGVTLLANHAEKSGGAIYANGGSVHISKSHFEKNCAEIARHVVESSRDQAGQARFTDSDGCPRTVYYWRNSEDINIDIDGRGGAIRLLNAAQLSLDSTTFKSNKGSYGGAIASTGPGGSFQARGGSFVANYAHAEGGALYIGAGTADIRQSSFQENSAEQGGGAIFSDAGQVTVANAAFHNNRWAGRGNAISNSRAALTLTHVTILSDAPPIAPDTLIDKRGGSVKLRNSIIAGGGPGEDCSGGLDQSIGNLSADGSCGPAASGDLLLGAATGSPATIPPLNFSPAIDAAAPDYCLESDQIGTARPQGGGCDIGAIEATSGQPAPIPIEPPPPCPLAMRIIAANTDAPAGGCPAGKGHDIIQIHQDIRLREALPRITSQITIEGNGYTISGGRKTRIFDVDGGALTIRNLSMTEGNETFSDGGALRLMNGALATVQDSRFIKNRAESGGAIFADSHLSRLTVSNSRFEGNRAYYSGGAIFWRGVGRVNIHNSSFGENRAGQEGGAISITGELKLNIVNSSFISNRSNGVGGALSGGQGANITLDHVTMLNNRADRGLGQAIHLPERRRYISPSAIYLRNSLLAGSDSALCHGALRQNIGNFIADGSCSSTRSGDPLLTEASGDAVFVRPRPASPLLQAADPRFCSETDQLGNPRAQVGRCDIGAIESVPVSRDLVNCSVTTTHGLNFRAAPAGERIGSVPENTTMPASARTPGWFRVEHRGASGWISADYVSIEGVCNQEAT